jgi:hypothetical protein
MLLKAGAKSGKLSIFKHTEEVKKIKTKKKGNATSSYQNKPPALPLVPVVSQRRPWAAAAQL